MGKLLQLAKPLRRSPESDTNPYGSGAEDEAVQDWEDVLDLDKPRRDGTKQGNTKTQGDRARERRARVKAEGTEKESKGELPPWRIRMEKAVEEVCEGASYSRAAKNNFLSASEVRRHCLKHGVRAPELQDVKRKLIDVALAYDLERRLQLSNKAFTYLENILDEGQVDTPEKMRSWATAFGVLIDKRRLEEGQATMRVETLNGGAKNVLANKIAELAARNADKEAIEAEARVLDQTQTDGRTPQLASGEPKIKSFIPDEGTYEGTFEVIDSSGNRTASRIQAKGAEGALTQEDLDDLSVPRIGEDGEEDWSHLNDSVTEPELIEGEDLVLV